MFTVQINIKVKPFYSSVNFIQHSIFLLGSYWCFVIDNCTPGIKKDGCLDFSFLCLLNIKWKLKFILILSHAKMLQSEKKKNIKPVCSERSRWLWTLWAKGGQRESTWIQVCLTTGRAEIHLIFFCSYFAPRFNFMLCSFLCEVHKKPLQGKSTHWKRLISADSWGGLIQEQQKDVSRLWCSAVGQEKKNVFV